MYTHPLVLCLISAQPAGQPEICKQSLVEDTVKGGKELFIIGKNFTKGSKVMFREANEHGGVVWDKEAKIDMEYFQPVWTVYSIPMHCVFFLH